MSVEGKGQGRVDVTVNKEESQGKEDVFAGTEDEKKKGLSDDERARAVFDKSTPKEAGLYHPVIISNILGISFEISLIA